MAHKRVSPKENGSVHFVGIGGIGVSSLARYFLAQNWRVTGSDSEDSELIHELGRGGAHIKIGHTGKGLPYQTKLLIYSQAIRPENPERTAARKLGIPEMSYPQMIGMLTDGFETIAIAGAHGKSTTSAITALVLTAAGLDPTVIIGTKLREFGQSNFRSGEGKYLVLEADEYGRAFLNYVPSHVIVTNIDREHLDIYKNLRDIQNTFLKFLARTRPGGTLVLNRDRQELYALRSKIVTLARHSKYRVIWYRTQNSAAYRKVSKVLKVPGAHNRSNATAVLELARSLKIPEKVALKAIGSFRGTWRRLELRGSLQLPASSFQLPIYDDYAHHPTEVAATLAALKEKYPKAHLVCVFQPHQAKRLKALFPEFTSAFQDADTLILVPMYTPAGRDTVDSRYTSESLVQAIQHKYPGKKVVYLTKLEDLKKYLTSPADRLPRQSVLVMMGAGNISNYIEILLQHR